MNRALAYTATFVFAALLSAGVSDTARAAVKVTKNTADWVIAQEEARTREKMAEEAAEREAEEEAKAEEESRQAVVDYALSFVGGTYVYGGNDPHSGVDCSGFTRYVMSHAAGIYLNRSSREQVRQGLTVSAEQMKPGDLLFYGNGSRVNHVALYIGDGKIVHASTERTGIKVSPWNYRAPVRIASFL